MIGADARTRKEARTSYLPGRLEKAEIETVGRLLFASARPAGDAIRRDIALCTRTIIAI